MRRKKVRKEITMTPEMATLINYMARYYNIDSTATINLLIFESLRKYFREWKASGSIGFTPSVKQITKEW